jgi:hypothetical protein
MAVGKEALIPSLCVSSAACRAALDETVSKFAEACAATPVTTIRRRIKDAKIEVQFADGTPASGEDGESKARK